MVLKAYKKLWIIRRLKSHGAEIIDLVDMYVKQVRCMLELAVPVWAGAVTQAEIDDIERVQKGALHVILGENYINYRIALNMTDLETLELRRTKLCLKFALKAEKHPKFTHWFKRKFANNTRQKQYKYYTVTGRTSRLMKSPISHLINLLNEHYSK